MSSNPYENEPGFETANSKEDKKAQGHYVNKVIAVNSLLTMGTLTSGRLGMKLYVYRLFNDSKTTLTSILMALSMTFLSYRRTSPALNTTSNQ